MLGRLHYVRATAEETEKVCRSNYSDNRWTPSQQGRSAYSANEQFRNGHYYASPNMRRGIEMLAKDNLNHRYVRNLYKVWET
jgi:hypothetical protein